MSDPTLSPQAEPNEVPIGQVLSVFWRGRWIILGCTLLSTVIGFVWVQQRGTIWRAASRVYVEKKGSTLGPESLLLGIGAKNYANTQAEVMISSEILEGAVQDFRKDFASSTLFEEVTNEVAWLQKALSVKVGRDHDIITVSLDSNLKEEACAIVNGVVEGYQSFQASKQKSSAREIYDLLEKDRVKFEGEWTAAIDAQSAYRVEHPGVGTDSGGLSVLRENWRNLSTALTTADNELLAAKALWDSARELQAEPGLLRQVLPSLIGNGAGSINSYPPNVAAITTQIQQYARERADMLLQLSPENPRVTNLDAVIAELRDGLTEQDRQFAVAFVESLHQRYLAAEQKREQLAQAVAAKEKQVYELDALDTEYRKLLAKADQSREAISSVLERLRQINVDTENEPTFVTVLDMARPDSAEVASGKPMRLAAALLLGLFLGCGLAWLWGLMDQRIRTADEVQKGLGVPILAILPRVARVTGKERQQALALWSGNNHFAEAARSLRTAVYFGMTEGDGNIVQVTSPDAGDGKTTIAASLAIAMAKAGQRTLLVDADLRKPRQAEQFGLGNEVGLSTVLAGGNHFADAVQSTEIPELQVLASGPVPPNPAEVLNSQKFDRLLAELAAQYDRVIVDSPPVLPVADARIISTKCSVTILALRVDKSTRKRAAAARDLLAGVGATILGVALNDMPHGIGYGYGAGYGYYGRYGGYGGYGGYVKSQNAGNGEIDAPTPRRDRPVETGRPL